MSLTYLHVLYILWYIAWSIKTTLYIIILTQQQVSTCFSKINLISCRHISDSSHWSCLHNFVALATFGLEFSLTLNYYAWGLWDETWWSSRKIWTGSNLMSCYNQGQKCCSTTSLDRENTFSVHSHLHHLINVETGFVKFYAVVWWQHWKGERGWNIRRVDGTNYNSVKEEGFFSAVFQLLFSLIVVVYGSSWAKKSAGFDSGYSYLFLFGLGFTHIGWKCSLEWPHFTVLSNYMVVWHRHQSCQCPGHEKVTSTDSECDLGGLLLVDFLTSFIPRSLACRHNYSWKQGKKYSLTLGCEI